MILTYDELTAQALWLMRMWLDDLNLADDINNGRLD